VFAYEFRQILSADNTRNQEREEEMNYSAWSHGPNLRGDSWASQIT
jgi:hypothetical protein